MVYILFNNQDVIGLYDSVSLLKQNSFITVYRMMKQGDIEKDVYFKLKSTLLGNFNIPV